MSQTLGVAGFTTHTGKIAVLAEDNIDTDRIIPARFLTRINRTGYGELLFKDVRGPNFVLDRPEGKDASILVVGNNFGCGSSREHAVWAIQQGGFMVVVSRKKPDAPGFADIFRQNSANCGLLLVEIEAEDHAKVSAVGTGHEITIDLPNQKIFGPGFEIDYLINEAVKGAVMEGLDLIGTTLKYETDISKFEEISSSFVPGRERVTAGW